MKIYLISDTHFNHAKISTYCDRPKDFTEIIIKRWQETVKPEDLVIHLGDVLIGRAGAAKEILGQLPGRKVLVQGNHDRHHGLSWWMEHGFEFATQGLKFHNCWLTHQPSTSLADGTELNIHGHLHNVWHGFGEWSEAHKARDASILAKVPTMGLKHPWQRLFAVEYTDYRPVEFEKFVSHPDKYQSRGPKR